MSENFKIGDGVERAGLIRRYERKSDDPLYRPLQIYSTDPADSKLDGTRVTVNVPYEELQPGPVGGLFEVIGTYKVSGHNAGQKAQATQAPLDLNDPRLLVTSGLKPAPTAHFQMQMTYAVAMTTYAAFQKALGRDLHWGFDDPVSAPHAPARLKIFPFFMEEQNAYYDREAGAVYFGWYVSQGEVLGRNLRRGKIYTALSHDIIVHEISHALLDGLRPNFLRPYHQDTLALHEGFADLVAIFQHFSHRELLQTAIVRSRGKPGKTHLLTDIARQFGQTKSNPSLALRTSVDDYDCKEGRGSRNGPALYGAKPEIHELGSVLVSAVFEAFTKIFDRKTRRYIKLATGGSGILPNGDLEESLVDVLAKEASALASQFLLICIRAIDYCPPVAVTFGDYLRAMITADYDLVPDDPYGYREALVDAFIRREIPIDNVETLSESALLWPMEYGAEVDDTLLAGIQREFDEFASMTTDPVQRYKGRANRIGEYLWRSGAQQRLGLKEPRSVTATYRDVEPPCIESARISRRVGPDGQLETDLVVEITQRLNFEHQGMSFPAIQACTVIVDSRGKIRYVIRKDAETYVSHLKVQTKDKDFKFFKTFWLNDSTRWKEHGKLLAKIHGERSCKE